MSEAENRGLASIELDESASDREALEAVASSDLPASVLAKAILRVVDGERKDGDC